MRDSALGKLGNIAELREAARRRLPSPLFDFLDGGAEDEGTLRRNTESFGRWDLLPRFLTDVAAVDPATTILGQRIGWPVILAPTGTSRFFHPEGERAIARAAAAADTIYCLSTMSTVSMEDIGALTPAPKWFQVYCFKDRELTLEFFARAKAAGFTALCVTVDVPVAANRERDRRSGMTIPPRLSLRTLGKFAARPGWAVDYLWNDAPIIANVAHKLDEGSKGNVSSLGAYVNRQFDPSITWKDIAWMVERWDGPLMIKGLLHPGDVKLAASVGAKAAIISNHGGRQLDGASAAIDALPRIADAVGDDVELILDGGIRRGAHVLKALALGAKACMIGRAYLYGLAAAGEAGVARALTLLRAEVVRDMALMGACTAGEVTRDQVVERERETTSQTLYRGG
jgi:L-lactate dehydrogenase (cytochrome)